MAVDKETLLLAIETDPRSAAKGFLKLQRRLEKLESTVDGLNKKIKRNNSIFAKAKKEEVKIFVDGERRKLNAALKTARTLTAGQKGQFRGQFEASAAKLLAGERTKTAFSTLQKRQLERVNDVLRREAAQEKAILEHKRERNRIEREMSRRQQKDFMTHIKSLTAPSGAGKASKTLFAEQMVTAEKKTKEILKNSQKQAQLEEKKLRQIERQNAKLNQQKSIQNGIKSAVLQMVSIYTAFAAGRALFNTGQAMESIKASLLIVSGSSHGVAQDFQFIQKESLRTGQNMKTMAEGFVKLGVAGKDKLDPKTIKETFVAFTELSTAVGADPMRAEKGLQAIAQMMSKGQIMAEELNYSRLAA